MQSLCPNQLMTTANNYLHEQIVENRIFATKFFFPGVLCLEAVRGSFDAAVATLVELSHWSGETSG